MNPADPQRKKLKKKDYERALGAMHVELVKMQESIRASGHKVVVIFEGRDAAGKGGVIKRISEPLNPRICRVVALGTPSDREKSQWYFQRYVAQLPAAGEMVLFDRSWYNRAGVERVMGFCSDDDYWEFLRSVSQFEQMLTRSGIILLKYWFSVSDDVQEQRFRARSTDPVKRWKLSPMDVESRAKWQEYSRAKDRMLVHTDVAAARWHVVNADDKKRARLNCIAHLLAHVPYEDQSPEPIDLGERKPERRGPDYERPPLSEQNFVPEQY